ncbi:CLIP domain-containing serine protease B8-like [Topomyia yanbarensis]|uniref:CLIP domain-containing serine protease B8-like n=1 Tax=Topomyia yanbarensis TaxID=2498891 RepID=UPI00273B2603|nr:CLIP domain-containing serine protease B8-like [Topomyia yanbarensis]
MLIHLALLVLLAGISSQQDDHPVWEIHMDCKIPNEQTGGTCSTPKDCPAFQEINRGPELASVGRISFIRALECPMSNETLICCPRTGSYRNPKLSTDLPRRERNESSLDLGNRFGEGTSECGFQAFNPKIQGSITEIDEFPWAALLFYRNNFHGCGGVLISRTYVLTAAHCLSGKNYDRFGPLAFVRLREHNTLSDPDCMVVSSGGSLEMDCTEEKIDASPRSIKVHPNYLPNSQQQHHDIGLVEIDRSVPYSDFLRPICLPEQGMRTGLASGRVLSVCGWGRTDFFNDEVGTRSPVKMKARLPFVDQNRCGEAYKSQLVSLGPGQICAGGKKDRDSCAGDSGSPLMFYDALHGVWVLTGIVSRGASTCGMADRPGIYTNVKEYLPWIKQNAVLQ